MKKFLFIISLILIVLVVSSCNSNSTKGTEGLDYYPLDDGTYGVDVGNANLLSNIVIPKKYNKKHVTVIMDSAFKGCKNLTSIVIPNSVTKIGKEAFAGCSSLASITIPSGVTTIEESAFANCKNLVNVEFPNSVITIDEKAFFNCNNLTSIDIPSSVKTVKYGAFDNCNSLTRVNYLGTIEQWCNISFTHDSNPLENHADFYLNGELVTTLEIPDTVWIINDYAFIGASFTSVIIPNSVTTIGWHAFESCKNLVSIIIPNSVTSIDSLAFQACNKLTIYCEAEKQPSGWNSSWNYNGLELPVIWGHTHSYTDSKCICGKSEN